ncbi:MAG: hypothetical protein ABSG64_05490 [Solirubrobacteraceae bacterium]|jgi:hypothetical protein
MRRAVALTSVVVASLVGLAACGSGSSSSGLIPTESASTITTTLSQLSADLTNHNCVATTADLQTLYADIQALPPSVAAKLRDNLIAGENTIAKYAPKQCAASKKVGPTGPTGPTSHTGHTQSTTSPTGTSQSTTSPTGTSQSTTSPTGTSITPGGGAPAPTGPSGAIGTGTGTNNGGGGGAASGG